MRRLLCIVLSLLFFPASGLRHFIAKSGRSGTKRMQELASSRRRTLSGGEGSNNVLQCGGVSADDRKQMICVAVTGGGGDDEEEAGTNEVSVDLNADPEAAASSTGGAFRKKLLAEAVGTAMIVLFGCGSVLSSFSGAYSGIGQVACVWGIGVALAIYATADISGAHLNPAVTLAFFVVRRESNGHVRTVRQALLYMAAQLAGAIAAGALNLGIYSGTIKAFERAQSITRGSPKSILSASGFGECE